MAASLVKSFANLCIRRVPAHGSAVCGSIAKADILGSTITTRRHSLLSKYLGSFESRTKRHNEKLLASKQELFALSVRPVTQEIKQWREHRVINRFYRLHWGAWIRCRGGRHRKLYRKSAKQRWLLQQHIFCSKTHNKLLDKLVTAHWKEPKYFVDSPYQPYHRRTNFSSFPNHRKFYP